MSGKFNDYIKIGGRKIKPTQDAVKRYFKNDKRIVLVTRTSRKRRIINSCRNFAVRSWELSIKIARAIIYD